MVDGQCFASFCLKLPSEPLIIEHEIGNRLVMVQIVDQPENCSEPIFLRARGDIHTAQYDNLYSICARVSHEAGVEDQFDSPLLARAFDKQSDYGLGVKVVSIRDVLQIYARIGSNLKLGNMGEDLPRNFVGNGQLFAV